jgi:circadian clock protein KaiB
MGHRVSKISLRLYIAGDSTSARRAQHHLDKLREAMRVPCEVEVIDVLREPQSAERAGIIATPTLSYEHSARPRRVVGDLSESKRVLDFLGIETKGDKP